MMQDATADISALPPAAAECWQNYLRTLPPKHRRRQYVPDTISFGDTPALADQLAALVRTGRKRATASLAVEFTAQGQQLPAKGDMSIVMRGNGTAAAIIELTEVRQVKFAEVDAAFAEDEGEGDKTLAYWRSAHRDYFRRVGDKLGEPFDEKSTKVICQRFRAVWRAD
jgi:uncharacterized protein YhfF